MTIRCESFCDQLLDRIDEMRAEPPARSGGRGLPFAKSPKGGFVAEDSASTVLLGFVGAITAATLPAATEDAAPGRADVAASSLQAAGG